MTVSVIPGFSDDARKTQATPGKVLWETKPTAPQGRGNAMASAQMEKHLAESSPTLVRSPKKVTDYLQVVSKGTRPYKRC